MIIGIYWAIILSILFVIVFMTFVLLMSGFDIKDTIRPPLTKEEFNKRKNRTGVV